MGDPLASGGMSIAGRADRIALGTLRLLGDLGYFGVRELALANGRRADIAALGPRGDIWIIEVKSSVTDFRTDQKWPDYLAFCDTFAFAVDEEFPRKIVPESTGLIVADRFGGALIRQGQMAPLAAARRKAVTLRLARVAALRLTAATDADWTPPEAGLTSPLP